MKFCTYLNDSFKNKGRLILSTNQVILTMLRSISFPSQNAALYCVTGISPSRDEHQFGNLSLKGGGGLWLGKGYLCDSS
jgi:hypothetical protein